MFFGVGCDLTRGHIYLTTSVGVAIEAICAIFFLNNFFVFVGSHIFKLAYFQQTSHNRK